MNDIVNRPEHYTNGKYECIDIIDDVTSDLTGYEATYTANIIKYLWRWKKKNGVQDLKKAQWYLTRLIGKLEGNKAMNYKAVKEKIDTMPNKRNDFLAYVEMHEAGKGMTEIGNRMISDGYCDNGSLSLFLKRILELSEATK